MEQQPAIHTWITELLSASHIQKEDEPGAILLQNGTTIRQARIYGTTVSTNELIVDDGTGSILVRTFADKFQVNIGDTILVIGKPRVYNQECYILGEVVKKIDKKWLEVREKQHPRPQPTKQEDAVSIVKQLDSGEGADYNQVIAKLGKNGEELIVHLLAVGELFETRPGKLKVLE